MVRILRVSEEAQEGPCASLIRVRGKPAPLTRGLQRLEPDDGKLSCPVLRGGSGSNAASLPDRRENVVLPRSRRAGGRTKAGTWVQVRLEVV